MKDLLVVAPYEVKLVTDLEIDCVFPDEPIVLADFLNKHKKLSENYKCTLFLDGRYTPLPNGIQAMYAYLQKCSDNIIVGAYSDVQVINDRQEVISSQINKSYSPYIVKDGAFIDSPLMTRIGVYPTFDNKLSETVIYDAILSLMSDYALFKCPTFCFRRSMNFRIPDSEIEHIKKKHYE